MLSGIIIGQRQSHPSRVRGLKPERLVAFRVYNESHPSRVRGLKHVQTQIKIPGLLSHPSRVRGLKQKGCGREIVLPSSHPSRVRGLKTLLIWKIREMPRSSGCCGNVTVETWVRTTS